MKQIYNINGLVYWSEQDILTRTYIKEYCIKEIKKILLQENKAWQFFEIEAPILLPYELLNKNYTKDDVYYQENNPNEEHLVLRPETTPSSFWIAAQMLQNKEVLPPFVVHQAGKSFRRENDQVAKNVRLKEFYQQEFQCIYTKDTLNDYQQNVLEPIKNMFEIILKYPARIVESDRLPSYSLKTMDIEVYNGNKWMEICSISKRTDFPINAQFTNRTGVVEKELMVLEIAIGLDRCVYNLMPR